MVRPYIRVSLQGSLVGGEKWSVNPAFAGAFNGEDPVGHADLQAAADSIGGGVNFNTYPTLMGWLSSQGRITNTRVSYYGSTGALVDYAEHPASGIIAGSDTLKLPPTAACALSLSTGIPGRSYRGRIYWPTLGASLDASSGRYRTADCTAAAAETVAMLAAFEAAMPTDWDPFLCVYSQKMGTAAAVTQIRVGDLVDSQRGRKDAFSDNYSSAPFPG